MTSFWFLQVDVQVQSKGNNTVQMQIANTAKLQMNTIKQKSSQNTVSEHTDQQHSRSPFLQEKETRANSTSELNISSDNTHDICNTIKHITKRASRPNTIL